MSGRLSLTSGIAWRRAAAMGAFVFLLLASVAARALDPGKNITQYGHDIWTQQNGLPGRTVYQALQGGDGYLWLRTSVGLVRFDGVRFQLMEPVLNGVRLHEPVTAICIGADGSLLLRSQTHTMRYSGGQFHDILAPAMLYRGNPKLMMESRRGDLIIGTDGGVSILRGSEDRAELSYTGWIQGATEDARGVSWVAGSRGIYRFENGAFNKFALWDEHYPTPLSVLEDKDHSLLIGTMRGLYRLDAARKKIQHVDLHIETLIIQALMVDHNGNLWLGTRSHGLLRVRNGQVKQMRIIDGLTDDDIKVITEDREGGLWVGTAAGLDHFRDSPLTTYTIKDGMSSNEPDQVIEARDGGIWLFCQGGGLTQIKNGKLKNYTQKDGLANLYGNGLFESRDGSIWAGTTGAISRLKNGRARTYKGQGHFGKPDLSAISEDEEGVIFANNESTAFRLHEDGSVAPYTIHGQKTPVTDAGVYTYTIHKDADGSLWFGATNGLYHFGKNVDLAHSRYEQVTQPVVSIADDGRGNLWVGGYFAGVTRVRKSDGRAFNYALEQGMFDSFSATVLVDQQGGVWASTADGIYHAQRAELDEVAAGRMRAVNAQHFGIEDGMKSGEAANMGHQPSGVLARDGRMWFATRMGVVVVDPARLYVRHSAPAPVVIEELEVDGKPQPVVEGLELPPGAEALEFHYTSLSLSMPQRTRFRYMLEGYDHEWVEAGGRRVAYYTNLPPGHYRFRVIACNEFGEWSEAGASLELSIQPHFYQTPWFVALSGAVLLLLIGGLHRGYTRRLRRHAAELSEKVAERTKDLESQRAFLRSVIDISPDLIYVKDEESRFVLVNQAVADVRGVPVEKLLGHSDLEMYPGSVEDQAFARDDAEVLSTGREKYVREERMTDCLGRVRWLQTVKRPIIGPYGEQRYLLGVSTDITERRQNEEKMRLQSTALESASNAIIISSVEGEIVQWVNAAFTQLTGLAAEDVIGRNIREIQPRRGQEAIFDEADRALAETGHCRFEAHTPGPDGTIQTVDETVNTINDADGKPLHRIAIMQDITEKRELERRLSQAQKMEAVGNLAGGVAHDFNNMMQVVLGHLDILNRQLPSEDPNRRRLAQMRDAATRSAALTRQLLAFSSRQVLQPVVMDLNVAVREIEHMLRRLIGEDIRLTTHLQDGLGRVKADPTQVEQIIVNLAVNARDAMPKGGEVVIATADVDLDDEFVLQNPDAHAGPHVLLEIRDTGVGMSAEVQAHIFEPFYTTKGFGKGTGLGLATVYGIVRQSGGYIRITSAEGAGSVFHIYLPRAEGESSPQIVREAQQVVNGGDERILIVEDNVAILALATETLSERGYKVSAADSPVQALRMAAEMKGAISLLITDVVMPEMSGPAMAEKLVADNPRMRVLYISGYTNEIVLRYGGMDFERGFLQKPFDVEQLQAKVREILDAPSSTKNEAE